MVKDFNRSKDTKKSQAVRTLAQSVEGFSKPMQAQNQMIQPVQPEQTSPAAPVDEQQPAPKSKTVTPHKRVGSYATEANWKAWKTCAMEYDISQTTLINIVFDYMFLQGHIKEAMNEGLADKYANERWV